MEILHAPNAGVPGSIPDQGTRSHMLHLKIMHTTTKIPRALPKTQCSQIKKKKKKNMVLSANKYGSEQGPILALMEAIKNSVIGKNNTEQSS